MGFFCPGCFHVSTLTAPDGLGNVAATVFIVKQSDATTLDGNEKDGKR